MTFGCFCARNKSSADSNLSACGGVIICDKSENTSIEIPDRRLTLRVEMIAL
jgi:hypothetical protein